MKRAERKIKEKFEEERNPSVIRPLNAAQKEYMRLIREKDVVVATGYAGTSKTFLPTSLACDEFRNGNISQIFLVRPNVSNSKSLGYFSGSLEEKSAVWLAPVLSIVNNRIGKGATEIAIKRGDIAFVPLEVIKGYSFENAWVIVDEAEDITEEEAKKIITRVGKNCKIILAGDISQSELKDRSGLRKLIKLLEDHPELENYAGHIDFNRPSDIVRSDVCREFILAFNRDEKKGE